MLYNKQGESAQMWGTTSVPEAHVELAVATIKDLNFQHHKKSGRAIPPDAVPTSPDQIWYLNLPWNYPTYDLNSVMRQAGWQTFTIRPRTIRMTEYYGGFGDNWHFIKALSKLYVPGTYQHWIIGGDQYRLEFNGTETIKITKNDQEVAYV